MRSTHPARRPTVEILIVSHNTAELLADCLTSISCNLPSPNFASVSVAVFDNGSTDGSVEVIRSQFPSVRLLSNEENIGFARANNRLAKSSRADYLLLLNSDTRFKEDAITPLLVVLQNNPSIGVVGPRLIYPSGDPQYSSERFPNLHFEIVRALQGTRVDVITRGRIGRMLRRYRRVDEIDRRVSHRSEFLWATCWLLPAEEVHQHGLFDEHFVTYDEDLDFCWRLRQRGRYVMYLATSEVIHLGGASSTSDIKRRLMFAARQKFYRRTAGLAAVGVYRASVGAIDRLKYARRGFGRRRAESPSTRQRG